MLFMLGGFLKRVSTTERLIVDQGLLGLDRSGEVYGYKKRHPNFKNWGALIYLSCCYVNSGRTFLALLDVKCNTCAFFE